MPYQSVRTPIGRRSQRIQIQALQTSDDGMGGQVAITSTGWATIGTAWAKVTALDERTKEAIAARQLTASQAYHLDIPYREDVEPTMRILWPRQTLEIQSVSDDDGRKRRLILLGTEVQ